MKSKKKLIKKKINKGGSSNKQCHPSQTSKLNLLQIQADFYKYALQSRYDKKIKIIGIQSITPKGTLKKISKNETIQDPVLLNKFSKIAPEFIVQHIKNYIYEQGDTIILLSQGDNKTDKNVAKSTAVAETIQQVGNLLNADNINVGIIGITDKSIQKLEKIFNLEPIQILETYHVDEREVDREILKNYYPKIDDWFNRKYVPDAKWAKDQLFSNLISDITYIIHPIKYLDTTSLSYHIVGNYINI